MVEVSEGDLVYYREVGSASYESARVIEKVDSRPIPMLFLDNGKLKPQSAILTALPAA